MCYIPGVTRLQMIRRKYRTLKASLNERGRRIWAVTEAQSLGYGGASLVARATGISRSTIIRGSQEIREKTSADRGRVRRTGGGRKKATAIDAKLRAALERLVDPVSRGDPESALRWTCKSTRRLASELTAQGHAGSEWLVRQLLYELHYSLQANRKTKEGGRHPDRDAQFRHINAGVSRQVGLRQPAISVDAKKKELVGNFKNGGREWRPRGSPHQVKVHDFIDKTKGKVIPYGVYDLRLNRGWVSVGIDHETASFAVNTILHWWRKMGSREYPRARSLLIVADSGGSNGNRVPAVEVGAPAACRCNGPDRSRLSSAPGDEQVEQNRTPTVLVHQPQLAGPATTNARDDRGTDCEHANLYWPECTMYSGYQALSQEDSGQRRTARRRPFETR